MRKVYLMSDDNGLLCDAVVFSSKKKLFDALEEVSGAMAADHASYMISEGMTSFSVFDWGDHGIIIADVKVTWIE